MKTRIRLAALAASFLLALTGCTRPASLLPASSLPAASTAASEAMDTRKTETSGTAASGSASASEPSTTPRPRTEAQTTTASAAARTTTSLPAEPPLNDALTPVSPEAYYGLRQLQKKKTELAEAYRRIVQAVENMDAEADVADLRLTTDEIEEVITAYLSDYPQHFWRKTEMSYSYAPTVLTVKIPYAFTRDELPAAQEAVRQAAAGLLDGLTDSMSAYDLELAIHDRLAAHTDYDQTLTGAHIYNLYGALVDRLAVCQGYAEAFQYLLQQAGIPCLLVRGEAGGERHIWNMPLLGEAYVHTDVTWDDPIVEGLEDKPVSHAYFNLTTAQILESHTISGENYALPDCRTSGLQYYAREGLTLEGYSAAEAARLVRKAAAQGKGYAGIWIEGETDGLTEQVRRDLWTIDALAGGGLSGLFLVNGREILFGLTS